MRQSRLCYRTSECLPIGLSACPVPQYCGLAYISRHVLWLQQLGDTNDPVLQRRNTYKIHPRDYNPKEGGGKCQLSLSPWKRKKRWWVKLTTDFFKSRELSVFLDSRVSLKTFILKNHRFHQHFWKNKDYKPYFPRAFRVILQYYCQLIRRKQLGHHQTAELEETLWITESSPFFVTR